MLWADDSDSEAASPSRETSPSPLGAGIAEEEPAPPSQKPLVERPRVANPQLPALSEILAAQGGDPSAYGSAYWPGLHQDVHEHLAACPSCARNRIDIFRLQGFHSPHPLEAPLRRVHLDHWSCAYGEKVWDVLTMVDSHTKWAEAVVVADKSAEVTVVETFHPRLSSFLRHVDQGRIPFPEALDEKL
ncbi:MAG: uncharacterized protein KVP18_004351 [Porospora cf. gigantea A]|nr:MAG: hypothetical protein KVP18_004351 [Porospora cf. gigantea A]